MKGEAGQSEESDEEGEGGGEHETGPLRERLEAVRAMVKDAAPRKCLACLNGLAGDAAVDDEGKAEIVEAVLRGLVKLTRFDLVAEAWKIINAEGLPRPDHIATVVIKAMCRSGGLVTALDVIGELEAKGEGSWKEVYPVACQAAIRAQKMALAQDLVRRLMGTDDVAPVTTYNYLIKEFGKASCLEGVFLVMDAMNAAGVQPNAETVEFIANAAVRSVKFVTGAVSMETLPEAFPEACFAGRSNVGKSSLVNMVTNRKKLAFSSKTPGP